MEFSHTMIYDLPFLFSHQQYDETNLLINTKVITDKAKVSVSKSNIVIEKLIVRLTALLILVHSIRDSILPNKMDISIVSICDPKVS